MERPSLKHRDADCQSAVPTDLSARGSYRVTVGWRGSGARYPFRWGLGRSVYAGQTHTFSGRVQSGNIP
jgi:hypothetical protein